MSCVVPLKQYDWQQRICSEPIPGTCAPHSNWPPLVVSTSYWRTPLLEVLATLVGLSKRVVSLHAFFFSKQSTSSIVKRTVKRPASTVLMTIPIRFGGIVWIGISRELGLSELWHNR